MVRAIRRKKGEADLRQHASAPKSRPLLDRVDHRVLRSREDQHQRTLDKVLQADEEAPKARPPMPTRSSQSKNSSEAV